MVWPPWKKKGPAERWQEAERIYAEARDQLRANQIQDALENFERARTIAHDIEEVQNEAAILLDIGTCYHTLKRYEGAVSSFKSSRAMRKRLSFDSVLPKQISGPDAPLFQHASKVDSSEANLTFFPFCLAR